VASGNKPEIDGLCIENNQLTITGSNFSASNNQVWFTRSGTATSISALKVGGLNSNGTTITVNIPAGAGPGDVLVQNNGGGFANLSEAWPTNLQATSGGCGGGGSCPDPTNYCLTAPNSAGPGATIDHINDPSLSANNFFLTATGAIPGQLGIFYYGTQVAQVPFGDGWRCVGGSTLRLPVISIDSFGDAIDHLDFTQPPANSGPGQIIAGSEWLFQFWYRDPAAGMSGFNLSDGLDVIFCP
jgi:hypothetical protein